MSLAHKTHSNEIQDNRTFGWAAAFFVRYADYRPAFRQCILEFGFASLLSRIRTVSCSTEKEQRIELKDLCAGIKEASTYPWTTSTLVDLDAVRNLTQALEWVQHSSVIPLLFIYSFKASLCLGSHRPVDHLANNYVS